MPQQRALTCHLPCSETCNVELTGSYLKKENGLPGASSHMVDGRVRTSQMLVDGRVRTSQMLVDGRVIKEYRERSVLTQRSYKSWRFTPDHCRSKSPRTHVGYVLRLGRSNLSAAFSNICVTETKSSWNANLLPGGCLMSPKGSPILRTSLSTQPLQEANSASTSLSDTLCTIQFRQNPNNHCFCIYIYIYIEEPFLEDRHHFQSSH